MDKYTQLAEMIKHSKRLVFFGGAGVSTESGLPDYRSKDGKYAAMESRGEDPKKIMHIKYLTEHPEEFFERRVDDSQVEPNRSHKLLAKWQRQNYHIDIITQNVDSLHQKAGSTNVIELHGDNRSWYCLECGHSVSYTEIDQNGSVPLCERCSGIMRPNVIYFGEMPDRSVINQAKQLIAAADVLLIAGTSLTVSPARHLIQSFQGEHVVIVNLDTTNFANIDAELIFKDPVGHVLERVDNILEEV